MKKNRLFKVLLTMLLAVLCCGTVTAAGVKKITLNKTSVTALAGKSFWLEATLKPQGVKKDAIIWQSTNEKVAVITRTTKKKAKIKIVGCGTANISAIAQNGKYAVCKVSGLQTSSANGKVSIFTPDGIKTYKEYKQADYGLYYRTLGCVATAVAIVASGYGKNYTPADIHEGPVNKAYSERYAIKKMGESTSLYGSAAISLGTASAILKNIGIKNKVTYRYTKEKAYKAIKKHLKKGKPVIIKANDNEYNGLRIAYGHHAVVLLGLDAQENIICINPGSGGNYKLPLKTLINYHMTQASGNYKTPYVMTNASAGGYILVG